MCFQIIAYISLQQQKHQNNSVGNMTFKEFAKQKVLNYWKYILYLKDQENL